MRCVPAALTRRYISERRPLDVVALDPIIDDFIAYRALREIGLNCFQRSRIEDRRVRRYACMYTRKKHEYRVI